MTRFLLLRHADHDLVGRALAGRMEGVALNAHGREQAQALVKRLARFDVDAIYASPQQRARETVEPLAVERSLPVVIAPEFDEVDFGEWTGLTLAHMSEQGGAPWTQWCERRASAAPPGGEPFAGVARRARAGLE